MNHAIMQVCYYKLYLQKNEFCYSSLGLLVRFRGGQKYQIIIFL